jgi:uncharacterized protein YecT (DUF1311 family)
MNFMKKILTCFALALISITCLGQTSSDRFRDGVCFKSIFEKMKLSGPSSVGRELGKWAQSNFDANNRVLALASQGGKCYGTGDDCFRKNLSKSDYEFMKGIEAGSALLQGPQDPKKLPNIEIGLMNCQLILSALSEDIQQKKSSIIANKDRQKFEETTTTNLPPLAGPITGLKNCSVLANADAPLKLTCLDSNYALLDKELNAVYKQKMAELSEPNKNLLKQQQRAWLKKKIECRPKGLSDRDDYRPSMAIDSSFCENKTTSERIIELRNYQ